MLIDIKNFFMTISAVLCGLYGHYVQPIVQPVFDATGKTIQTIKFAVYELPKDIYQSIMYEEVRKQEVLLKPPSIQLPSLEEAGLLPPPVVEAEVEEEPRKKLKAQRPERATTAKEMAKIAFGTI